MPFFSDTSFQPKRAFRFLINFSQIADIDFMCTDAAKPSYNLGDGTTHQILNHKFKFPGIITWQDVNVNFIDAIEPNVGSRFYNMLLNAGYAQPVTFQDLLQGVTKVSSTSALGRVSILQLDGGAVGAIPGADPGQAIGASDGTNIIEEWTLHNAFLKTVNFGTLNYGSEEIVKIQTTITYDFASYDGSVKPYAGTIG